PTSRAPREPRDGEREEPTDLTGQLTVGEPQGSRRRAYEESRQAAAGSRLERTTRVARRLHRGAQGWRSHRGGRGAPELGCPNESPHAVGTDHELEHRVLVAGAGVRPPLRRRQVV